MHDMFFTGINTFEGVGSDKRIALSVCGKEKYRLILTTDINQASISFPVKIKNLRSVCEGYIII
jgi:hypothetical protein